MAQLDFEELFQLIIRGDQDLGAFVRAVVDRKSGQVLVREGKHLDFKQTVQVDKEQNAAELARDILAFSNTEGGILLLGVTDSGKMILLTSQYNPLRFAQRNSIGIHSPFDGTRGNAVETRSPGNKALRRYPRRTWNRSVLDIPSKTCRQKP